jgi:membrane-associated phospholipid phosphatase
MDQEDLDREVDRLWAFEDPQQDDVAEPATSEEAGVEVSQEYALRGAPPFYQVEPEASYWSRCRVLSTVTLDKVRAKVGAVPSYPPPDSAREKKELEEIRFRQRHVHDSGYFDREQRPRLSSFLQDERYIQRPPEGAVLNRRGDPASGRPGPPVLKYGAELATLFEGETPGLWHRHVFNILLDSPVDRSHSDSPRLRELWSPPRQALVWHALDTAIASALNAIWHYKWIATHLNRVARRRRPWEADNHPILFDYKVSYERDGDIRRDASLKDRPQPTPGTPRHPAYGSGHSTYSAAASYVMGCLLPGYREDFRKLANNIGEARIWGGVHWRTDHMLGQKVGLTVGRLVIRQLDRSGISPVPSKHIAPPSREKLEKEAAAFEKNCGQGTGNFCTGLVEADNCQGAQG